MNVQAKKRTNLVIGAMLVVGAMATAFWILMLSPKREEADKLAGQIETLEASLAQHQSEAEAASFAKQSFSDDYRRLVLLGKAVPGDAETASLLVQLSQIAKDSRVRFQTLTLESGGGSEGEAPPPASGGIGASPTEAAAALLPLGASVGPAGLAVMPYSLSFEGDFFAIADFIDGLDDLVKTTNEDVAVDGRLITVDSFSLASSAAGGFPRLQASFSVTTYLIPPGQGLTGGASAAGPETEAGTLASMTTGVAP
jgi:Tfp pilus assembly protein PilO